MPTDGPGALRQRVNGREFLRRRATGPSVGILALLLYLVVKERTRAGTGPECGEHAGCEQRSQAESAGTLSADVSAEASAVGPSAEASGIRTTNGLAA